jgi:comEA protein
MLSFSRNEERFLFFFLSLSLLGCLFHYYRKTSAGAVRVDWQVEQNDIYRFLQQKQDKRAAVPLKISSPLIQKKQRAISGKININQATVTEMSHLPRIGPVMAGRIIEFRQNHGPFKSIDELLLIKGIGEKTFARIQDRVTIE